MLHGSTIDRKIDDAFKAAGAKASASRNTEWDKFKTAVAQAVKDGKRDDINTAADTAKAIGAKATIVLNDLVKAFSGLEERRVKCIKSKATGVID